ncbi:tyrosine-type recombinase/integrase [Undibacterium seohonense]|uniref:Tyrosine-type recombinase/integrase n=1 Tax=Undibacterium seohonense TaxID=1344950 RepID=A0ABR6XAF4_9BURK|nr:phage integrase family protein [Undibacterium seohonense]MBC3809648.1 tyrosine-type recombinase/integrase [Undibacterium seohonense]
MTQHAEIVLQEMTFTRTDFAAMRAYAQKIPIQTIASSYYSEDSPQLDLGLERFLIEMRNALVERAIQHNPHFAEILKGARQGGSLTVKALDILIKAADAPKATPQLTDAISKWFRPKTVVALRSEGLLTLSDLINMIYRRGGGWWRSIPRIGKMRADVVTKWINTHSETLGNVVVVESSTTNLIQLTLDPNRPSELVPIDRLGLPSEYSGTFGINRSPSFCYIQANNDKDALLAYLTRFADQPHTFRAYRKELERFLLWSVMVQRKPMSSLLVDDCEDYKVFLRAPLPSFTGMKVPRSSSRWKPFTEEQMSAKSQKHAILVIRACFKYLVDVRYLAGNPWSVVKDPSVTQEVNPIRIERALTDDLWERVVEYLQENANESTKVQERIALAALLLMGDSGLRRQEVANSQRHKLKLYNHEHMIYTLEVHGKGNKNRLVPVSVRTVDAIKAHWKDRNIDFDTHREETPLLSPITIPRHKAALKKHEERRIEGYSGDSLYPVIMRTWKKIQNIDGLAETFSIDDIDKLATSSPHAYRHTFGTLAVEAGMPLDVAQAILGHASSATTGIYVRTKEKRMVGEAAKFFGKKNDAKI